MPTVTHTFPRAKYKETNKWEDLKDPVGSVKRDGASFFMEFDSNGKPRFTSRRESVKGGYPDRTENLTELSKLRLPEYAGNVYHVELIHTGHDYAEDMAESHPTVSGILNSLKDRALQTQKDIGPVRAVLLDVIHPKIATYGEKLEHLKDVKASSGPGNVLIMPDTKIGKAEIQRLIERTKALKQEGIIVTSLSTPEEKNVRFKVKHVDTYNLRVSRVIQEVDIYGVPKESMGALEVVDASGRIVANVGTGFTREQRKAIWANRANELGKLIQVKAMLSTATKLRSPVYNGDADGDIDLVEGIK